MAPRTTKNSSKSTAAPGDGNDPKNNPTQESPFKTAKKNTTKKEKQTMVQKKINFSPKSSLTNGNDRKDTNPKPSTNDTYANASSKGMKHGEGGASKGTRNGDEENNKTASINHARLYEERIFDQGMVETPDQTNQETNMY